MHVIIMEEPYDETSAVPVKRLMFSDASKTGLYLFASGMILMSTHEATTAPVRSRQPYAVPVRAAESSSTASRNRPNSQRQNTENGRLFISSSGKRYTV